MNAFNLTVSAKAETDLSSPACTSECHDLDRSRLIIQAGKSTAATETDQ